MAAGFGILGILLRYYKCYGLVGGYNTASPEEKKRYDIDGLPQHLGNGLMTIGVMVLLATVSLALGSVTGCVIFMLLLTAVSFIMIIGGQKFLPARHHTASGKPQPAQHRFLKCLLPVSAFAAIERGTRLWGIECPCGHLQDYREAGGVRYKAAGKPGQYRVCPQCGKAGWLKIRKKTAAERQGHS